MVLELIFAQVPLWVWLIWSPQLLMSLQRGEGPHARALLVQIAQAFPQAIYYSLRTMVLCLREFAFKVVQVTPVMPAPQGVRICEKACYYHSDVSSMVCFSTIIAK